MPPMPTKCMRRVRTEHVTALPPAARCDRRSGRPRPAAPARAAAARHPLARRAGSCGQRQHLARQPLAGQARAPRSPPPRRPRANASAFLRWWSSVAVGSGTRIAGRPAAGQLRQRRRAGARRPPGRRAVISRSISCRNGSTRASSPARRIRVAHQLQIPLAGLVRDRQRDARGRQPRRRRHHRHVDRVRALRAAKDQHPHLPSPRRRSSPPPRSKNSARTGLPVTKPVRGKEPQRLRRRSPPRRARARQQPVGEPGQRVLLEQQRRDSRAAPPAAAPAPS